MIVLLFQFLESTLTIRMLPKYNWAASQQRGPPPREIERRGWLGVRRLIRPPLTESSLATSPRIHSWSEKKAPNPHHESPDLCDECCLQWRASI